MNAFDQKSNPKRSIHIYLNDVTGKGKYFLNFHFDPQAYSQNRPNSAIYIMDHEWYITSSDLSGFLIITKLDISKKIISGTFEFEAKEAGNSNKKVKITKGRFDLSY
jgi:hypothetical protein